MKNAAILMGVIFANLFMIIFYSVYIPLLIAQVV